MNLKSFAVAAAIGVAAIAAPASAVTNAGFETGSTSGWANVGTAYATTTYTTYSTWSPYDGSFFAVLNAGLGANVYSTLSQTAHLNAGQTIKGAVGYQANDYQPFADDAYLTVGGTTLFTASTYSVGDFGNTGWVAWSYTAPTTGYYVIELGVRNTLDNGLSSSAFLDSAVPEPGTWALMIAGFGMVGFAMRRRKVALAA